MAFSMTLLSIFMSAFIFADTTINNYNGRSCIKYNLRQRVTKEIFGPQITNCRLVVIIKSVNYQAASKSLAYVPPTRI